MAGIGLEYPLLQIMTADCKQKGYNDSGKTFISMGKRRRKAGCFQMRFLERLQKTKQLLFHL